MALTWSPKQFELARAEELAVVASLASTRPWIVSGLVLSAGTGLNVAISAGAAWIEGYYVEWDASAEEAVTGSATNHVWIELTRDGNDNVTAVDFVVNTTGVAPTGDNVKLGTATTDGSGVTGTATTGRSPQTQVLVESVFGRGGVVVAASGDYDADEVDYDNATSGLTATDVQAAVDELAARPIGGGWDGIVVKKVDENVTTGMQDDDELFTSVAANKTYYVHLSFYSTTGGSFEFDAPASSTFTGNISGIGSPSSTSWINTRFSSVYINMIVAPGRDLLTSQGPTGAGDAIRFITEIHGVLTTSTTAGTLQFRYGVSSGTTTIYAGSVLRIKDIT